MNRNIIPFLILALCMFLAMICGCATYGYNFTDADGSNVAVHDLSFLSRRDLADTASAYQWTSDGSGNWNIGQSLQGTNSTDALPVIDNFFKAFFSALAEGLKIYAASLAPAPITPPVEIAPLTLSP